MSNRLPTCENCLIRNILLSDQIKNGIVHHRVFKDKDQDGLSLYSTRSEIIGLDDLNDYISAVSANTPVRVGVAVFLDESAREAGLQTRPSPHSLNKYGRLHVVGPIPDDMTEELRRDLAYLANQSGWSRAPESK